MDKYQAGISMGQPLTCPCPQGRSLLGTRWQYQAAPGQKAASLPISMPNICLAQPPEDRDPEAQGVIRGDSGAGPSLQEPRNCFWLGEGP